MPPLEPTPRPVAAADNLSTTHRSVCPMDCPDTCSLDVTVRDGRVVQVDGNHRNPLTDGFICAKVRNFDRHIYGEHRLLHPLRRVGRKGEGRFERLSWDEALDLAAGKLRAVAETYGGEAILPFCYGGSNGLLSQDSTDARLFRRLRTSQLRRAVCAAPTSTALTGLYGKLAGVAFQDYEHAKLIVIWGANPSASGIHLVPVVQRAQAAGAQLIVIDPRRTPLAKKADLHLAPRPGTDLPMALGLVRWLFEQDRADLDFLAEHTTGSDELRRRAEPWTLERASEVSGVPVADLERFARVYADTDPAVLRCGYGQERNRNGGSATAAIIALPAVAGKFGRRAGGFTMSNSGVWKHLGKAVDDTPPATRILNMNRLGRDLLAADPPVRLLFVYNANPLSTLPEQVKVRQGLERKDLFTVVFEQVMTDTAHYADLLLPATTFLEHRELKRAYGAYALQDGHPVIPPVGEARSNLEVFADLTQRLALDHPDDASDADAIIDRILDGSGQGDELRQQIQDGGVALPPSGARPIQFVDAFPGTPDRKIHLVPPALDAETPHGLYQYQVDPGTETYPLALISPALRTHISSTFGQLHRDLVPVELHPDDAAARGLRSGENVRVYNGLGEVRCPLKVNPDLRPGVAVLPKGIWSHNTHNGLSSNALSPATYADLGEGACFNDARVEVAKV